MYTLQTGLASLGVSFLICNRVIGRHDVQKTFKCQDPSPRSCLQGKACHVALKSSHSDYSANEDHLHAPPHSTALSRGTLFWTGWWEWCTEGRSAHSWELSPEKSQETEIYQNAHLILCTENHRGHTEDIAVSCPTLLCPTLNLALFTSSQDGCS